MELVRMEELPIRDLLMTRTMKPLSPSRIQTDKVALKNLADDENRAHRRKAG